jgi:type IV secretory pathway VirB4 component
MKNISTKNLIKTARKSELRDFSVPNAEIEELRREADAERRFFIETGGESDNSFLAVPIKVPYDLELESQNAIKKGGATFIDAVISFEEADGAEYYEFRVSKVT